MCTRVLMRVVAEELYPTEFLAVTAQGPRLPQSGAGCSCGMANEAVHTAIEAIRDAAPPLETRLDIPSSPIHARTGPFNGDTPAVGKASGGDSFEAAPKAME